MPRSTPYFVLLAVILTGAVWMRVTAGRTLIRTLENPQAAPASPLSIEPATRTIDAGPFTGNQILALDGKPFRSIRQYQQLVSAKHPGDSLILTLSAPDGHAFETAVRIPSQAGRGAAFGSRFRAVLALLAIPVLALALGAFVVAVRPANGNAWLLLLLMISLAEIPDGEDGATSNFALIWRLCWSGQWPVFLLLLGFRFPERSRFDRRPWWKYLLVGLSAALLLMFSAVLVIWHLNINSSVLLRPLFVRLDVARRIVEVLSICVFFLSIGIRQATLPSADSRRRVRILLAGSSFALLALSLLHRASTLALLIFSLFPLTLAYVIVAERAMNLTFLVRQIIRGSLTRVSLWSALVTLAGTGIFLFSIHQFPMLIGWAVVAVTLLLLWRERTTEFIDRFLFRELSEMERALSDLATEAAGTIETGSGLNNLAQRLSDTLHVQDIVVLIRDGELFVPCFSTRPGEPMNIPVDSRIAQKLRDEGEAVAVWFDRPPRWIRGLDAEELQTLDFMRSRLLLPLFDHGQLAVIMSLGPKRSEAPYSQTEIRLLQAIASHMTHQVRRARLQ